MVRNSTERLVAICSRENPLFSVYQHGDNTSTQQAFTNVLLCFFKGMVFLAYLSSYLTVSFLANCCAFGHSDMRYSKESCVS